MSKISKSFQLKITLSDSKPPIWREIIVPADYTFFDLHVAIQDAFGWTDCHLHQFFIGSPYKSGSIIIAWPHPDDMCDVIDERELELDKYLSNPKDKIYYEYDFGDGWMHKIELRKVLDNDAESEYPQLIGGARACPPEDCGGMWGYYNLIEIIKDSKHKEHEEMMEWMGFDDPSEFDPEHFDKDEIEFESPKEVLKIHLEDFC